MNIWIYIVWVVSGVILSAIWYFDGYSEGSRHWKRKYEGSEKYRREVEHYWADFCDKLIDSNTARNLGLIRENTELRRQLAEKEDIGAGGTTD